MKVLMIKPYSKNLDEDFILPLTVYHIASVLNDNNHEVAIMDQKLYCAGKMECGYEDGVDKYSKDMDVIAFTVNTFDWCAALIEIKRLRGNGYDGYIILGGAHASLAYMHIMEKYSDLIDFIMIGDAETNMVPLLKCLESNKSFEDVPGVVYVKDGKVVFNPSEMRKELPETSNGPAYSLMPKGVYRTMTFECSRGCYGRCSFCTIPFKRSWRPHRLEYIEHTFDKMYPYLQRLTTRPNILTTDDCFTTDTERAVKVIEIFKKKGLQDCIINLEARVMDFKDDNLLSILKEFPNVHIQVGVEAGSDKGFQAIHKPVTMDLLYKNSEKLARAGLNRNVFYSFIVGLPNETADDCFTTLETSKDLFEKFGIISNVAFWLPIPSESFELLRSMVPSIDYSLYDKLEWYQDKEIFIKGHPNLNDLDIMDISQEVYTINSKQSLISHDYI